MRGQMLWLLECRSKDREQGLLQEGTPMLWRWTEGGIVMLVEVSDIWPAITGIGEEGDQ